MRKKSTVSYELDPERLPPLTAAQRAELEALATVSDEQIDASDIPLLSEAFWKNAVRNPFYRPVKQQLTVRLDADVLAWLRSAGRGYQTKLNAILRQAMVGEVTTQASPINRMVRQHPEEIQVKGFVSQSIKRRLHPRPDLATSPAVSNDAPSPFSKDFSLWFIGESFHDTP